MDLIYWVINYRLTGEVFYSIEEYDEQLNGLHGITISDEVKAFYSFKM
jgi:hypothetical protein